MTESFDPGFARALLEWYNQQRRDLPWRRTSDPYAVWVSEIMLQQTRVATVIPYFERWLDRFPDIRTLAAADEQDVLHSWQGLGYYSRARSLLKGAREVVARFDAELPRSFEALLSLPGIGPYTAGAIASIAFEMDEPAVDGNVVRVLCRLEALDGDPTRTVNQKRIRSLARRMIPTGHAADFNQALMELGAVCCLPRSPLCDQCPVRAHCQAFDLDTVDRYPETKKKAPPTALHHVAVLGEWEGRIFVQRIPDESAWWSGMWRMPSAPILDNETTGAAAARVWLEATGATAENPAEIDRITHHVTRYRIRLSLVRVEFGPSSVEVGESGRWMARKDLTEIALPAPFRKLLDRLPKD